MGGVIGVGRSIEGRGRQWGGVMNKGRRGTTGEKEEITG